MPYIYCLEAGSRKHVCPRCGKKTFVRYIDNNRGEYPHYKFGRCDREIKCGYHLSPLNNYHHNKGSKLNGNTNTPPLSKSFKNEPCSRISPTIFTQSHSGYSKNNLIIWLSSFKSKLEIEKAISKYYIGTSYHWPGSTVFWQVDQRGRIRTGKIMLYSPVTGRRVKEPFNHITWVHSVFNIKDFKVEQCLFGEHLLNEHPELPVGIVESEKTAIVASMILPHIIWLATGNLNNLNIGLCKVLKGRKVVLFPDLDGYGKWRKKANVISSRLNTKFTVSGALEQYAHHNEVDGGADLADCLPLIDISEVSGRIS